MPETNCRRTILRPREASGFVPYDRYGAPVPGLSWINISFDPETGCGSYLLRMEPGSGSLPHEHVDYEDFFVVDGELVDDDGTVFRAGDFVSFRPGTVHSSHAPRGCTIAVFLRAGNRLTDDAPPS